VGEPNSTIAPSNLHCEQEELQKKEKKSIQAALNALEDSTFVSTMTRKFCGSV
jgi:hypothetical protein